MYPLFTVIIPTHNRPGRLATALRSVREQVYANWELIVIDDGSSPPVQLDHVTDHSVSLYRQDNAGPGAARRLGALYARGDVLLFLDDDDYYLPNHLNVLAEAYRQRQCIYVVGMRIKGAQGTLASVPLTLDSRMTVKTYWNQPISLLPFAFPRQVVLDNLPVDRRSPIEDFDWLVRVFAVGIAAHRLPSHTVVYVQHEENRTSILIERSDLAARERVIEDTYRLPEVNRQISVPAYRKLLTHQRLHWTRQCLRAGQWKDASYGLLRTLTGGMGRSSIKEFAYTLLTAWRAGWSQLWTSR